MAGLLDWLSQQKDSAMSDYAGLMDNYPNAQKFGNGLINNISQHIPSNEDFHSPHKMGERSMEMAMNAPMGLMFTGPKSAGWNHEAANTATKLLDNGADPAQVWKDHLIGRMPDGKLFSEIDDSGAKFNLNNAPLDAYGAQEMPIFDALNHNNLQKEYPDLESLSALHYPSEQYRGASFDPKDKVITFGHEAMNQGKSVSLHELQHAIQNQEGWARGGSPDNPPIPYMDEINKIREETNKLDIDPYNLSNQINSGWHVPQEKLNAYEKWKELKIKEDELLEKSTSVTPMQAYQRLTGEAQARATQDRMNMDMQQRRDTYPLAGGLLSDIPLDQLINRYR
jgi:hypothetical protein